MLHFIERLGIIDRKGTIALISALLLCLVPHPPAARAQANVSARVLWYGIYTGTPKEVNDPTSPTGKRFEEEAVPSQTNTAVIPARGLSFGVGYVLTGPREGTIVPVKHVYRFPPGGMPDTPGGGIRTTYEHTQSYAIGRKLHIGWIFSDQSPAQIVPGLWVFEVWHGGRRLIEQRFTVGSP